MHNIQKEHGKAGVKALVFFITTKQEGGGEGGGMEAEAIIESKG